MPQYTVGLSSASLLDLSKKLHEYAKSIEAKQEKAKEKLCEIGKQEIEQNYASGYLYTGEEPNIRVDINEDGVTAQGNGLSFIEFGTGVENKESPVADKLGVKHGEYGKGHGKRKAWAYYGEPGNNSEPLPSGANLTRGADAHNGVYDASIVMRSKLKEVAEEVFK